MHEGTGKEVELQGILKGYEVSEDQYVVFTQDELEAAAPSGSRAVEIEDFADQSEIDPIHFDRTHYLAPRNQAAVKPYSLLREAMRQAGKVGIASFAMRGREHLAAIRVGSNGDVTILETLFFADEIHDPLRELDLLPDGEVPNEPELALAVSLVDSMSAKWGPERCHDRYRARVMQLIEQKHSGEQLVVSRQPTPASNVVDLMEVLRRSVEQVREEAAASSDVRAGAVAAPEPDRTVARPAAQRAGGTTSKAKAPKTKRPGGEQLSMLSKDELCQPAQSLAVPGRSRMSRYELELAVSGARTEDGAPTKRSAQRASSAVASSRQRGRELDDAADGRGRGPLRASPDEPQRRRPDRDLAGDRWPR